jgi:hypothetical protein
MKSPDYDPRLWEDGCMCPWTYGVMLGAFVVLSPILVPALLVEAVCDNVRDVRAILRGPGGVPPTE